MSKILIACEESGTVSAAFKAKGHFVVSCDLYPGCGSNIHYTGDVLEILNESWDALIAFPPCTYLTHAQTHLVNKSPARQLQQQQAIAFFLKLYNADHIPLRCIENPPGALSRLFRKPNQVVMPGWFGDDHWKRICLWLVGFPPLIATCYNTIGRSMSNHTNGRMSPARKSQIKSKFFPQVAEAMANQWTTIINEHSRDF